MNERRLTRLQEQIKQKIASIFQRDMADPKLGLITVTRVELDAEFTHCKAWWSVLGDAKVRARTAAVLTRARGFIQREIGKDLHTRTVPHLELLFDERIEGALKMQNRLDEIRRERETREAARGQQPDPGTEGPVARGESPRPPTDAG